MLNDVSLRAQTALVAYIFALQNRFEDRVQNNWVWAVVFLVLGLAAIGYGVYCTYRGLKFSGSVKIGVPDVFHVTVGCK